MLSGVNTAIVRALDEQELYADICRIAVERGGFETAYTVIVDAQAQGLVLAARAGLASGAPAPGPPPTLGRGLLDRALRERSVAWDIDVVARPDAGNVGVDAVAFCARAVALLPFVLDDAVRSVMVVHSATPDAFGGEELELMRELAGDVSFALDHLAKKRQLDYLATHDMLTGLANRSLFLDRLAQAISTARDKHESVGVVLGDVEGFKHLNDALGRHAGDALLRMLADRIRHAVEGGASLARVGGDVFALIFTEFARPADVANDPAAHGAGDRDAVQRRRPARQSRDARGLRVLSRRRQ